MKEFDYSKAMAELDEMKEFDYSKAMAELDEIATRVEDPSTGLDDIDKYIKRSEELIEACRKYLRTQRRKVESLGDTND